MTHLKGFMNKEFRRSVVDVVLKVPAIEEADWAGAFAQPIKWDGEKFIDDPDGKVITKGHHPRNLP